MTATARLKHSFSKQHLKAADYFAEKAVQLEESNPNTLPVELHSVHRAYVTGAILSTVAGLESSINELFLEPQDSNKNSISGLTEDQVTSIAAKWPGVEKDLILGKYDEALTAAGVASFDKGREPYQGAAALIKLRNALTHYKPEWDDEALVHYDLETRLNGRFRLSPYHEKTSLWMPHQCLAAAALAGRWR